MKFCKKGAMFGLDARIALVVFATLSIISIKIIYEHFEEVKALQKVTTLNNLEKAIERYVDDTGHFIPDTGSLLTNQVYLSNLISNQADYPGWNGPYFGESGTFSSFNFKLFGYSGGGTRADEFFSYRYSNATWGGPAATAVNAVSCNVNNCYIYLVLSDTLNPSHSAYEDGLMLVEEYKKLDEYIDNSDGPGLGKIRMRQSATSATVYIEVYPEFNYMTDPE